MLRQIKVPVDAAPTGKRVLVVGSGLRPPTTSPAWGAAGLNIAMRRFSWLPRGG